MQLSTVRILSLSGSVTFNKNSVCSTSILHTHTHTHTLTHTLTHTNASSYSAKGESPCFTGAMEINDHLKQGRRLFENEIVGPEGIAMDHEGVCVCVCVCVCVFK